MRLTPKNPEKNHHPIAKGFYLYLYRVKQKQIRIAMNLLFQSFTGNPPFPFPISQSLKNPPSQFPIFFHLNLINMIFFFLIYKFSGHHRSVARVLGRRYFAASTEEYAKRNYANNVSEYNSVVGSLTAQRRYSFYIYIYIYINISIHSFLAF